MVGSRVTRRYAKALFDWAQEKNLLVEVEKDLRALNGIFEKSVDLRSLLDSLVIQKSEKKQVVEKLFKEKLHPLTFQFLNLLLEKKKN